MLSRVPSTRQRSALLLFTDIDIRHGRDNQPESPERMSCGQTHDNHNRIGPMLSCPSDETRGTDIDTNSDILNRDSGHQIPPSGHARGRTSRRYPIVDLQPTAHIAAKGATAVWKRYAYDARPPSAWL